MHELLKCWPICEAAPSSQRCRMCQKPHHTLLHQETIRSLQSTRFSAPPYESGTNISNQTSTTQSHVAQIYPKSHHALVMACCIQIIAANGLTMQARGLFFPASSISFILEHMTQSLSLHHSHHFSQIVGIRGISHQSISQFIVYFCV